MNLKTTILGAAAAIAMSASSAFAASVVLDYGTDVVGNTLSDGSLDLNFVSPFELHNGDDYSINTDFNLKDYTALRIDPFILETGTLTVSTFVDPFAPGGIGLANVLITVGTLLAGDVVTAQWGTGPVVDITAGNNIPLSTTFSTAGLAGAQDLVFTWDVATGKQLSANVAAVPLPAGILLLGTALGGLGVARRRKAKKADA